MNWRPSSDLGIQLMGSWNKDTFYLGLLGYIYMFLTYFHVEVIVNCPAVE